MLCALLLGLRDRSVDDSAQAGLMLVNFKWEKTKKGKVANKTFIKVLDYWKAQTAAV